MVAIALFDEGSYVDQHLDLPQSDSIDNDSQPNSGDLKCSSFIPFASLFNDPPRFENCIHPQSTVPLIGVTEWLPDFQNSERSKNALHAVVLLAGEVWLANGPVYRSGRHLIVYYDLGQDTTCPKITKAGIYVISTCFCLDLLLLFILAVYVRFSPAWTSSLDAYVMMRMGTVQADELPLEIETDSRKATEVLERMRGWVSDARPEERIELLALGASTPLKAVRESAYASSDEVTSCIKNRYKDVSRKQGYLF